MPTKHGQMARIKAIFPIVAGVNAVQQTETFIVPVGELAEFAHLPSERVHHLRDTELHFVIPAHITSDMVVESYELLPYPNQWTQEV